jgi:hypothetical protein
MQIHAGAQPQTAGRALYHSVAFRFLTYKNEVVGDIFKLRKKR